jgi:hypothetical protein
MPGLVDSGSDDTCILHHVNFQYDYNDHRQNGDYYHNISYHCDNNHVDNQNYSAHLNFQRRALVG